MEKLPLITKDRWRNQFSIEPTVFLAALAMSLSEIMEPMLLIQKACTVSYSNGKCGDEENAQEIVAGINIWRPSLRVVLTVFPLLLAGYYTERYPHKVTMIFYVPIIGHTIRDLSNSINVIFWDWSPLTAALCQSLIPASTGSLQLLMMTSSLYVLHTTCESERTFRFVYLYGMVTIGEVFGMALSGYVKTYFNLFNGFLICALVNVIGMILALVLLEPQKPTETYFYNGTFLTNIKKYLASRTNVMMSHGSKARLIIILTIVGGMASYTVAAGEEFVIYLYMRYVFSISDIDFSNYSLFKQILQGLGLILNQHLFQRIMKLNDSTILLIQCTLNTLASTALMFIKELWQFYVATVFQLFQSTTLAVANSWTTKYFELEDYNKICTLFGVLRAVSTLLPSFYSLVYQITFTTLPSAIYILSTIMSLFSIIAFWYAAKLE